MRDRRPVVSVIIPCYNLGRYLDETVESVLAQTYQDFEIVIVNDGSTDAETNRLLLGYERPKTRVIQSENRGLPAARNLALNHALGTYISALDADDKLAPRFLEKTVQRLNDDPGLTFVSCWLETFGTESWVWKQDRCDLPTLLHECTVATPALVRKEAVQSVGGYDEHMVNEGYEDWDLWISLVEQGYRGAILPEVLFYYRRRPDSMSQRCCHGEVHLNLIRYMISKHEASYRAHLVELLCRRETVSCDLLKASYALEREVDGWLAPKVERRREELKRLRRRLAVADARGPVPADVPVLQQELKEREIQVEALTSALRHAEAECAAVRQSLSWRAMAGPRAVAAVLQRLLRPSAVPDRSAESSDTRGQP